MRAIVFPDHKATVIKIVWCQHKDRHTDIEMNRTDDREVNPHTYDMANSFSTTAPRDHCGKKSLFK